MAEKKDQNRSRVHAGNNALDALVRTTRKDDEVGLAIIKETLNRESVEKLFQSAQLGSADTTSPSQLQNTVWFQLFRL